MAKLGYVFKKARVLTLLLQVGLAYQVFSSLIVGVALVYSHVFQQKLTLPPGIFQAYQVVCKSFAVLPLIVFILSMFWIYRANKNTHILSAQKMEYTPGWAAGWFFVPVASLVKPYFVVSELYNANRQPLDWRQLKPPLIVGAWWAFSIIGNIIAVFVSVMARYSQDSGSAVSTSPVSILLAFIIAIHQILGNCPRGWQEGLCEGEVSVDEFTDCGIGRVAA